MTSDENECLERADRLLAEGVNGDRGSIAAMIYEAVQAEREACAKIAEDGTDETHPTVRGHIMRKFGRSPAIAAAIRARGA